MNDEKRVVEALCRLIDEKEQKIKALEAEASDKGEVYLKIISLVSELDRQTIERFVKEVFSNVGDKRKSESLNDFRKRHNAAWGFGEFPVCGNHEYVADMPEVKRMFDDY